MKRMTVLEQHAAVVEKVAQEYGCDRLDATISCVDAIGAISLAFVLGVLYSAAECGTLTCQTIGRDCGEVSREEALDG